MDGVPLFRDLRLRVLLRRAQRGDETAFRRLYRALHPVVAGFVARRVAEPADADDVVARVFEKLVVCLDEVDPGRGGARAFVLGVARNAVADVYRGRPPVLPLDAAWEESAGAAGAGRDEAARREEMRAVRALVEALPEEVREMFRLRFGDGLRHGEIARLLGVSEAAVKQRFSRALRDMRAALTDGAAEEAMGHGS